GSPMIERDFGEKIPSGYTNQWPSAPSSLYLKLIPNVNTQQLAQKMISQIPNQRIMAQQQYHLQSIQNIYLHSTHIIDGIEKRGSLENIKSFSIIAFLILSIACINFIILSTARSATRANEIGIRKVVGASSRQLIKQFLCESVLITLFSLPVAILLAELFIPTWNTLMDSHLVIHPINAVLFVSITTMIGILSGIYIAFIISSFNPVDIFTGKIFHGRSKTLFRKVLIGMQLSIFIGLCTLSIFVFQQMRFIQSNRTLGYDKDYLLSIDLPDKSTTNRYQTFKNTILSNHSILSVSASSSKLPNEPFKSWLQSTNIETNETIFARFCMNYVDYDYLETVGIQLIAGRSFSEEIPSDIKNAIILNETALKVYGGLELVGQQLNGIGVWNSTLIGVVKDYHVESLYDDIWPVCFRLNLDYLQQIVVRISADNVAGTIDFLQKEWKKAVPQYPFEYQFADDAVNQIYRVEQNIGKLIAASTLLAIFIACLGILGLSVYLITRRTKEIGLRKILGASITGIVSMLTKDFIKWAVLSNIFAWPIAWYAMNKWLQNFAYHVNLSWWIFVLSGVLTLVVALLTVSYQAIRAATANPVESLRYE
ncbi:FtsX-like permease family protein, partial [bacterium]|nr:FtsX-like permease family protein [bacterium]